MNHRSNSLFNFRIKRMWFCLINELFLTTRNLLINLFLYQFKSFFHLLPLGIIYTYIYIFEVKAMWTRALQELLVTVAQSEAYSSFSVVQ